MNVFFHRNSGQLFECESCGADIPKDALMWVLDAPKVNRCLYICEDCGLDMNNDMDDEYDKVVNLNL